MLVSRLVLMLVCFHPNATTHRGYYRNRFGWRHLDVASNQVDRIFRHTNCMRERRMRCRSALSEAEHDCFCSWIVDSEIISSLRLNVVLLVWPTFFLSQSIDEACIFVYSLRDCIFEVGLFPSLFFLYLILLTIITFGLIL